MPRPKRSRLVSQEPDYVRFHPEGIPPFEEVTISVDEYEIIRLVDLEKKTHQEAACQMHISRTTATEIYESARYKVADSLVNGKRLHIAGGNYQVHSWNPKPENNSSLQKGRETMRVAVTYENGTIFQHFGHTEFFKLYDIAENEVAASEVVSTNGSGHGALAGFLKSNQVDVLICGGIGGGAQAALADAGIQLYGGASGSADEAVTSLLAGTLLYDPKVHCSHHDHSGKGHSCGEHGCGEGHSCHL